MFRFEKYEDSLEEQWDKFITEKSINGTFLQSRRFFNYHPAGRFKDVSLVVYNEKNNIAALIPACELEQDGKKVFFSHKGTTFGGIIIDKKHHNAKHEDCTEGSLEYQDELVLHGCCLIFSPIYLTKYKDAFVPDTFMFREEELLYLRCKEAGIPMVYCPEVRILHLEDISTDYIYKTERKKEIFNLENQIKSLGILLEHLEAMQK